VGCGCQCERGGEWQGQCWVHGVHFDRCCPAWASRMIDGSGGEGCEGW
jgi:hypothetical protein